MNIPVETAADAQAPELAAMRRDVVPIGPNMTVAVAADLILRPEYKSLLCLPVVAGTTPFGTISRNQLTEIFLHRFGRELYGNRPVSALMNPKPLIVDEAWPLQQAAEYVSANIASPISEDFVIVRDGAYVGMGVVVDLLGAMQARLGDAIRQIRSSQTALVQNEKMASLGQMVAGVAHEINTPLGYVRNNVELARDVFGQMRQLIVESETLTALLTNEEADENALAQQLGTVHNLATDLRESGLIEDTEAMFGDTLFGVDTIRDLVINLRNFTRLDNAKLTDVSVNECLDQTLVIAKSLLRDRVTVIKRYGDVPRFRGAPSQINQVFLNLISNAAQAIDREDGKLLLTTVAEGGWLQISVQDNGSGMPPDTVAKIFEPFFTTKPSGQGTGLGLPISQQIVRAHGGDIRVASVPGKGTRFVVLLPLNIGEAPRASSVAAAA